MTSLEEHSTSQVTQSNYKQHREDRDADTGKESEREATIVRETR